MSPEGDRQGLCGQMVVRSTKDGGLQPRASHPQSAMLRTTEPAGWTTVPRLHTSDTFSVRWSSAPCCVTRLHVLAVCFKSTMSDGRSDASWRRVFIVSLKRNVYGNYLSSPVFTGGLESLFTSYRINNVQSGNGPALFRRMLFVAPTCFFFVALTTEAYISWWSGIMQNDINVCFVFMFLVKLSKRDLLLVIDEDRSNKKLQFSGDNGGCQQGVILK